MPHPEPSPARLHILLPTQVVPLAALELAPRRQCSRCKHLCFSPVVERTQTTCAPQPSFRSGLPADDCNLDFLKFPSYLLSCPLHRRLRLVSSAKGVPDEGGELDPAFQEPRIGLRLE